MSIHPVNFAEEKEPNCYENGSHIENNAGHVSGGGIFLHDSVLSFSANTVLDRNQASETGGGINAKNSYTSTLTATSKLQRT